MGLWGMQNQESRNVLAMARANRAAQAVDEDAWKTFVADEETAAGLR